MLVFKFGGASVKNAEAVKNLLKIVRQYNDYELVVVVSAMGRITALLEKILDKYLSKSDFKIEFELLRSYHFDIITDLFKPDSLKIFEEFDLLINKLANRLAIKASQNYDYEYDQIVSFGEMFSTKIISEYFNCEQQKNVWIDIRKYLKTNSIYKHSAIKYS